MSGTQLNLAGYKLTFDDQFADDTNADIGLPGTPGIKWETEPFYGANGTNGANPTPPGQPGSLFSLQDGMLVENMDSNSTDSPYLDTNPNGVPGGFSQQYGYFEVSAKLTGQSGYNSDFWMMPNSGPWPPEMDIYEHNGYIPGDYEMTNHGGDASTPPDNLDLYTVPNLTTQFNTFGFMWTPTTLTWYINGQEVFSAPTASNENQPFNLILSGGPSNNVAWLPPPLAGSSDQYDIQWVHAYSNDPNAAEIAGMPGYQDHDGSTSLGGSTGGTSGGTSGAIDYITPGVGSFTDTAGNVYTLTAADVATENGQAMNGGGGTGAMEYANGTVYGQDMGSGTWYTWDQSINNWQLATTPPPPPSGGSSGSGGGTGTGTGGTGGSSGGSGSTGSGGDTGGGSGGGSTVAPAPAAAVGYDTETLGPNVTIGGNWQKFDWFGTDPSQVNATQNADGSVTIAGGGNTYGGQLATATLDSNGNVVGEVFGGGLYAQATISAPGPTYGLSGSADPQAPAFWSSTLAGYLGSGTGVEPDFMEMDGQSPGQYGTALHYWVNGVATNANTGSPINTGTDLSQPHTYGFLWVPATATTQGQIKYFFDGQQVGNTVTWNQNDGSPASHLDGQQLLLLLGAGPNAPENVSNVQVWQASTAGDTIGNPPPPPPPPVIPVPLVVPGAGSFVDAAGNVYTLDAQDNALENGQPMNGGAGTGQMEYFNGNIFASDFSSGTWYEWSQNQNNWIVPTIPPPANTATGQNPTTITMTATQTAATTISESNIVLNLAGGNKITFTGGSSIINATGSNTVADQGSDNTVVLGATGKTTLNANALKNGDTFDLSKALAATSWDGNTSDLSTYLKMTTSGWNHQNAVLEIRDTATGSWRSEAVFTKSGALDLSQFLVHAKT